MQPTVASRWALLLCLAVGARTARGEDQPAAAFPPAPAALVKSIEALFAEGFIIGPGHLQTAQKSYVAAQKLGEGDPRLDYAYGLVLLRQTQHKQAVAQFSAAVGRKGAAYWPAWQALVWAQLVDKQYDKGLGSLDAFAAVVRPPDEISEPTQSQSDAARWIGQVLESLDKTVTAAAQHELIEQHDERLHGLLGDDLYRVVELGRDFIRERDLELAHEAGQVQAKAEDKQARRRQGAAGRLDSELQELSKDKEGAARSQDDWKKWRDDTLAKADKQMGLLEKDYQYLEKRGVMIEQSIVMVGREITALQVQMNPNLPGNRFVSPLSLQQQLTQRQNTMLNYQTEYNATVGRMAQLAEQGRQIEQQRNATVEKYAKETGDLTKKAAAIDKWSLRVADKKQKLETPPTAKAKGPKAPAAAKVVSFRSLVPLDLEAERARVLEAYGVKPEAPPAREKPAAPGKK